MQSILFLRAAIKNFLKFFIRKQYDTVADILEQNAYLGRRTNFKTIKFSYKSRKKIANPPEKWIVIENTLRAIIDKDTWNIVQKVKAQSRRPTKLGEMGIFFGLAFCAGCGAKLYDHRTAASPPEQEFYSCANYWTRKQWERLKRTLEKQDLRITEPDMIIQRLYEDHVIGKLSAERFAKLSGSYKADKSSGHGAQQIDEHYSFIGEIDLSPEYSR